MLVIFFRHGIAEEQGHGVPGEDTQRHLVKKGVRQTKLVARALKQLGAKPDIILTSPFFRAVETAEAAASAWKKPARMVHTDSLKPNGNWSAVLRAINHHATADQTVMLVGHQPTLGTYAMRALGGKTIHEFGFPKSGCIAINWEGKASSEPGELVFALSPRFAELMNS